VLRDLSLWFVYGLFGTQSLKHLALRFCPSDRWGARMERGFVSKSGAGDAGVVFLRLKSLGVHGLKVITPRDLVDIY